MCMFTQPSIVEELSESRSIPRGCCWSVADVWSSYIFNEASHFLHIRHYTTRLQCVNTSSCYSHTHTQTPADRRAQTATYGRDNNRFVENLVSLFSLTHTNQIIASHILWRLVDRRKGAERKLAARECVHCTYQSVWDMCVLS